MSKPTSDKAGVRQVIRALKAADCTGFVARDGENEDLTSDSEDALIEHLMSCDEGVLFATLPSGATSHVLFVYGNDPEEVAADWGVSLSPILDPLTEGWWE